MQIKPNHLIESRVMAVQHQAAAQQTAPADGELSQAFDSLRVSLSELGRNRAVAQNDDIEQSDLPDTIKETLKLIRVLKALIAEKQAELDALMADRSLDPERSLQAMEAVQAELSSLSGALVSANASLIKALRESDLGPEQQQQAALLATR